MVVVPRVRDLQRLAGFMVVLTIVRICRGLLDWWCC